MAATAPRASTQPATQGDLHAMETRLEQRHWRRGDGTESPEQSGGGFAGHCGSHEQRHRHADAHPGEAARDRATVKRPRQQRTKGRPANYGKATPEDVAKAVLRYRPKPTPEPPTGVRSER